MSKRITIKHPWIKPSKKKMFNRARDRGLVTNWLSLEARNATIAKREALANNKIASQMQRELTESLGKSQNKLAKQAKEAVTEKHKLRAARFDSNSPFVPGIIAVQLKNPETALFVREDGTKFYKRIPAKQKPKK